MLSQGRLGHAVSCLIFSALFSSVAGCAPFRTGQLRPVPEPTISRADPSPASPAPQVTDDRGRATLAAVEEFLARTESYRLTAAELSEPQDSRPQLPATATTMPAVYQGRGEPKPKNDSNNLPPTMGKKNQAIANTQIALTDGSKTGRWLAVPVVRSVTVRIPESAPSHSKATSGKKTTNTPLEVVPDRPAVTADHFIDHLRTMSEQSGDIDSAWQLRAVQKALGREPDGLDGTPTFSAETAKLFSALMSVIDAVRSLVRDPLSTGEDTFRRVAALEEVIAERADPIVETIAFCRRVVTFGVYDVMGDDEFVAGRSFPTIVYSEIRNFRSEVVSDGTYRTVFATRLEVLTAEGQTVWQHEEPEVIDRCQRRRRDFFIAQRVTIPGTLSAGEYVLKMMVEDKLSGRMSEAVHTFRVSKPDMRTVGR